MSEIEHVAKAIREAEGYWWNRSDEPDDGLAETLAKVAIAALDKLRAEEKRKNCKHFHRIGSGSLSQSASTYRWHCPECGETYDSGTCALSSKEAS